jgi:hypothetical protein
MSLLVGYASYSPDLDHAVTEVRPSHDERAIGRSAGLDTELLPPSTLTVSRHKMPSSFALAICGDHLGSALKLSLEPFDLGYPLELLICWPLADAGQCPAQGFRARGGDARCDRRVQRVQEAGSLSIGPAEDDTEWVTDRVGEDPGARFAFNPETDGAQGRAGPARPGRRR